MEIKLFNIKFFSAPHLTLKNAQIALLSLYFRCVFVVIVPVFLVTVTTIFALFISVVLVISASHTFYSVPRKFLLV